MARAKISDKELQRVYDAVAQYRSISQAAATLGLNYHTVHSRYELARERLELPVVQLTTTRPDLDPDQDRRLLTAREDAQRFKKAYATLVKNQAEEERLLRLFAESIRTMPAIPATHFKPRKSKTRTTPHKPEVPILLRSDQQIGEEISANETDGINSYNFDVFQARLESLEDRTIDILSDHQRAPMPRLVVPYLGDNISGRIHVELQKYGHQHVIDQVYLGAAAEALFLYRLLKFGRWNEIIVPCVSGNHGRLDKEKESKRYYKNFDYLFVSIMATFLRHVPQIKFIIPQRLFLTLDVAEHRILLSHGHEMPPSSLGIPLYSINRASASYQELLAMSGKDRFQYWFMGHFHRPLELDGSFVNGTMAGLSEFGIGKFKPIVPMQRLLGFHPKWGRAWEYPIRLDKAPLERKFYRFESAMSTPDAIDLFAESTRRADKDVA